MRKLSVIFALFALTALAQQPSAVLDKAIANLSAGGLITADYKVTAAQGSTSGSIAMKSNKFRILSADVKSWFDGKTQWTYSKATGEVNITTPTAGDLQMSNPYVAALNYKTSFNLPKAVEKSGSYYVIKLTPKKKVEFKSLTLFVGTSNYNIHKAKFAMNDGTETTISITNYKTKVKMPNPFSFNKALVPKGTQVVDLR